MKLLKSFFILALLGTSFNSCTDEDDAAGGTAGQGEVVASVGGNSFRASGQGARATRITNGGQDTVNVFATDLNGNAIVITMFNTQITTGSYEISDAANITTNASYTEVDHTTFTTTSWVAPYANSGDVGTVTITEISDTKIVGNFEFTGASNESNTNLKSITNGSFNLDFQ